MRIGATLLAFLAFVVIGGFSVVVRYPNNTKETDSAFTLAQMNYHQAARIQLTSSFYKYSKASQQEDKALYNRYFFAKEKGTIIEIGALVRVCMVMRSLI